MSSGPATAVPVSTEFLALSRLILRTNVVGSLTMVSSSCRLEGL